MQPPMSLRTGTVRQVAFSPPAPRLPGAAASQPYWRGGGRSGNGFNRRLDATVRLTEIITDAPQGPGPAASACPTGGRWTRGNVCRRLMPHDGTVDGDPGGGRYSIVTHRAALHHSPVWLAGRHGNVFRRDASDGTVKESLAAGVPPPSTRWVAASLPPWRRGGHSGTVFVADTLNNREGDPGGRRLHHRQHCWQLLQLPPGSGRGRTAARQRLRRRLRVVTMSEGDPGGRLRTPHRPNTLGTAATTPRASPWTQRQTSSCDPGNTAVVKLSFADARV